LTVATTNYDRAIELGALSVGVALDDGFRDVPAAEIVEWAGFENAAGIRLLKSHGSTDWYHDDDRRRIWKLRHAMPIFGTVRVTIENEPAVRLGSALVLPSREKVVRNPPYPDIAFEFRKAVDSADLAAFVGTSLRDPDLLDLATRCAKRIPTVVVGRSARAVPGRSVQMSASRFLMSAVPRMTRAADPGSALALAEAESGRIDPILGDLVLALDREAAQPDRCEAIDALAAGRVALEGEEIERLLHDDSADIRTYALGLVRDSPAVDRLSATVSEIASTMPDSAFAREAAILARLN
jgi:hypothetical protein